MSLSRSKSALTIIRCNGTQPRLFSIYRTWCNKLPFRAKLVILQVPCINILARVAFLNSTNTINITIIKIKVYSSFILPSLQGGGNDIPEILIPYKRFHLVNNTSPLPMGKFSSKNSPVNADITITFAILVNRSPLVSCRCCNLYSLESHYANSCICDAHQQSGSFNTDKDAPT